MVVMGMTTLSSISTPSVTIPTGRNTPITVRGTPLTWTIWPRGFLDPNSLSAVIAPRKHTVRALMMSSRVKSRPKRTGHDHVRPCSSSVPPKESAACVRPPPPLTATPREYRNGAAYLTPGMLARKA